ncbi:hypothetical protein IAQ61_001614 [Plenodomus lingam]|uniref:uncharacterized protein n=1 Tax=Leptosphaeria maculans TaxID=5022 RepID=UPI00332FCED1|nr:hypothetical protein IAQ61_001614 [Plenodomus lingam]
MPTPIIPLPPPHLALPRAQSQPSLFRTRSPATDSPATSSPPSDRAEDGHQEKTTCAAPV